MTGNQQKAGFEGWLLDPGPPFDGPCVLPYIGESKILIGPNGFGKTRLLRALSSGWGGRLFSKLPARIAAYASLSMMPDTSPEDLRQRCASSDLDAAAAHAEARIEPVDEGIWVVWPKRSGISTVELRSRATLTTPAEALFDFPVPSAELEIVLDQWSCPDAIDEGALASLTEATFRDWASGLLAGTDVGANITKNPLVARAAEGPSFSVLELAAAFAEVMRTRASERLRQLAGFNFEMRILVDDDFSWQLRLKDSWFDYSDASTAIKRWVVLSVAETSREFGMIALDSTRRSLDVHSHLDVSRGNIPDAWRIGGPVEAFATRSSWIAMDEPEVHLFGSEAHQLGESLSKYCSSGRLVIATHSLDLASRFVGKSEFVSFTAPGTFASSSSRSPTISLLSGFAQHGTGLLSGTRVLYVEGVWDERILSLLYGELLASHNIVINPIHGASGVSVALSSVLQRMLMTPFGIMLDNLVQERVESDWRSHLSRASGSTTDRLSTAKLLRRQAQSGSKSIEDSAILGLFANVIESGLESRVRFVMHGLSDIFQVCRPQLFGSRFSTWREAGYVGGSLKDFCLKRLNVDLRNGANCESIFQGLAELGHDGVDPDAKVRIDSAVLAFCQDGRAQVVRAGP